MRITEGYLSQHFQGRSGGRDPALLDIAQDHALALLHEQGVFDLDVVLKGGTALRKCRAGNAGRFSTDLDFAVEDEATAALVLDTLDGAEIDGFGFALQNRGGNRRADLVVDHPVWSPGHWREDRPVDSRAVVAAGHSATRSAPDSQALRLRPTEYPVMTLEEHNAEKLARDRRTSLARDLYDLAWCAGRTFDEPLVRRIWVLKCFFDIVDDGLGDKPVAAADVLDAREESSFTAEQIGYLTKPVDVVGWVRSIRRRFGFLGNMDAEEAGWASANPGDRWHALQAVEVLG